MRARFNGKHAKLSIIQCYAPTNDADDEEKGALQQIAGRGKKGASSRCLACILFVQRQNPTSHRARNNGHYSSAKKMEMAWTCVTNGFYSACKDSSDLESGGTKENGATKNNMEENDTGRDEKCWHWMGERHKISLEQSDWGGGTL